MVTLNVVKQRSDVPPSWADELAGRIARLEHDVRELRTAINASSEVRDRADTRWLATIGGSVKGRVFSVRELVDHAHVDPVLARALRGRSPKQVGKRLRALIGRDLGALAVQRVGRDNGGSLWAVQVVTDHLHEGSGVRPEIGA